MTVHYIGRKSNGMPRIQYGVSFLEPDDGIPDRRKFRTDTSRQEAIKKQMKRIQTLLDKKGCG